MIKRRHITSTQTNQMVGDDLGTRLWFKGLMNEIRRYPNEIPCDPGEIPSMILPFASGEEKAEWGFTAGMSCLSPGQDGSVIIRNAEHFPVCTLLALLSLLYDAGAAQGKEIDLKLRYSDSAEMKPFLDMLDEAGKKLPHVTVHRDGTLPKENRPAPQARSIFPLGNSVCVVQELQQIDVGRFCARVRCIDGSFTVKDDVTITDGDWNVLQEHCPVTLISGLNNKNVSCSDELMEDDFAVSFAMWFPPDTPAFDGMALIKEKRAPLFTPRPMPPAVALHPAEKESGLLSRLKGLFKKPAGSPAPAPAVSQTVRSDPKADAGKPAQSKAAPAAVRTSPGTDKPAGSQPDRHPESPAAPASIPVSRQSYVPPENEQLMISQLVALFEKTGQEGYRTRYLTELGKLGFSEEQAGALFRIEQGIVERFNKDYLTDPAFTRKWFIGLRHPFLMNYPKTKEDIEKERFFTLSEMCKFIDEAEWHFWNSHERSLPDGVFEEIYEWRLRGNGGDAAIQYCEAISKETGIPMDLFSKYINREGGHLNRYKWDQPLIGFQSALMQ